MRLERPAAWRLARSSRSCSSLSSKSSRSSVAAWAISRRLVSIAELLGEQRVEERHGAAEHVREHRESEFDREQPSDPVEQSACRPLLKPFDGVRSRNEPDDLVDDQLADIERCDRQQRARDPQQRLTQRQRTAGPPDELQERRDVAQRSQALPPRAAILSRQAVAGARRRRAAAARVVLGHTSLCPNAAFLQVKEGPVSRNCWHVLRMHRREGVLLSDIRGKRDLLRWPRRPAPAKTTAGEEMTPAAIADPSRRPRRRAAIKRRFGIRTCRIVPSPC